MLAPGKGKTHRAYLWAYSTTQFADLKAVVYEFAPSRAGEHARAFLGEWRGKLVCDDYSAYKAGFELGITEIGCVAHARRRFFELHASHKSQVAEQALKYLKGLQEPPMRKRRSTPGLVWTSGISFGLLTNFSAWARCSMVRFTYARPVVIGHRCTPRSCGNAVFPIGARC